jgi:hypothetical protein
MHTYDNNNCNSTRTIIGDGEGEDTKEAAATSARDEIKNNRRLKKQATERGEDNEEAYDKAAAASKRDEIKKIRTAAVTSLVQFFK